MTNTKFRRRALLSSVAMLLVALVALGSATFAWFSTTTTANAQTLTAGTSASSSLLIRETTADDWAQNVTFKAAGISGTGMLPITTSNLSSWQYAQADSYDAGIAGTSGGAGSPLAAQTATPGTYVAHTTLYAKQGTTGGAAATLNVTISGLATGNTANYTRVGIKSMATSGSDITATTNTTEIYGNAKDDYAKDPTAYTDKSVDGTATTSGVTTTSTAIELGSMAKASMFHRSV